MPVIAATAKRLLTALVAALVLLVAPAAAHADAGPVAPTGADVQTALQVAEQHWGTAPCAGAVTVQWTADPDGLLNATSTWSNPVDLWSAPERDTNCVVALNPNASWDWPKLCTVVAHEVGHLLGHQHVDDPTDLMNAIYTVPLSACAAIAEPEGVLTASVRAAAAQPVAAVAAVSAPVAAVSAPIAATSATATASPPRLVRKRAVRRHRRVARRHAR